MAIFKKTTTRLSALNAKRRMAYLRWYADMFSMRPQNEFQVKMARFR